MAVKEHLTLIEEREEEINLIMDRSNSILAYLKAQGVNIGPMEVQLKKARNTWEQTLKEVPETQTKIAPLVKQQGNQMRGDIQTYEAGVLAYLQEVSEAPFKVFSTGAGSANLLLETAIETHEREKKRCQEVSERSVRAFMKTRTLAMNPAKMAADTISCRIRNFSLWL